MQYGIAFTPLVPTIVLWIALAAIVVISALLLLGRARGAAVRVAALALILLALANPSFTREDREPLSSVAAVVIDKSPSQNFGTRNQEAAKAQEAVMDPTLTNGTRKKVTRLDVAFLRDMGWQTVAYPLLVGDLDQNNLRTVADVQILMTALTNLNAYQTSHGFSNQDLLTVANVNGDSAVTNTDLEALLVMLANDIQPGISPVPEPGGVCLVACGLAIGLAFGGARQLRRTIAIRALTGARRAAEPSAIRLTRAQIRM
jgi:hypothetical protein